MERDPRISKLIREGGVEQAPSGFTGRVMNLITSEPVMKAYKPLIGKGGRIIILLLTIIIVALSITYAEPGGVFLKNSEIFSNLEWKMPSIQLNMQVFSNLNLSGGIAAALVAMFILVLADARLHKRKLA
ncbi:MAG: hypothetical protein GY790_01200 [Bacteroidetes bacterium]|nr:hypothetical protein [Bacteroidota bacterium]